MDGQALHHLGEALQGLPQQAKAIAGAIQQVRGCMFMLVHFWTANNMIC